LGLITMSRRPAIQARWTQRQYVPSYVRLVSFHDASVGQPVVSCGCAGLP
jgi:hypothetical protein